MPTREIARKLPHRPKNNAKDAVKSAPRAQKKLARPRALLRTAATRTHRSGMSLYEQDEPLAGATAEKPAGEADLVVPDYAPAPAPIDPNAAAEKSCLDVIATVYPDADAVNKVAAAESAALQTRMCVWTQGAGRPAAPPLLHVVAACLAERHRRSRLGPRSHRVAAACPDLRSYRYNLTYWVAGVMVMHSLFGIFIVPLNSASSMGEDSFDLVVGLLEDFFVFGCAFGLGYFGAKHRDSTSACLPLPPAGVPSRLDALASPRLASPRRADSVGRASRPRGALQCSRTSWSSMGSACFCCPC